MITDFCGLVLTPREEQQMTFLEWRLLMNGTEDSNIKKIDQALSNMNRSVLKKADGFVYDKATGTFQLTSNGEAIGETITISQYSMADFNEAVEYIGEF